MLPGLPIQYWATVNLGRIVSYLGKPICTDKLTAQGDRISYARVLVDIDISQPLPKHILIENEKGGFKEQKLEHEWKPSYCQDCLQIGHTAGNCNKEQENEFIHEKGEEQNRRKRRQRQKKQQMTQWKVKDNKTQPPKQEQQKEEVLMQVENNMNNDDQGRIVKGKMRMVAQGDELKEGVMTDKEVERLLSKNRFSSLRIQPKEITKSLERDTRTSDKFPP
ncbi:uncharacterized protein [Nicotiana sylvestris]|uniref:uncharacterized protein n=1 Tax=Nicotiana sylvestris TaxID=4096 RepID=UPI00388CA913